MRLDNVSKPLKIEGTNHKLLIWKRSTTDQKSSGHAGSLENQGKYHYTTETTEIDDTKEISEEILEVEFVEVLSDV